MSTQHAEADSSGQGDAERALSHDRASTSYGQAASLAAPHLRLLSLPSASFAQCLQAITQLNGVFAATPNFEEAVALASSVCEHGAVLRRLLEMLASGQPSAVLVCSLLTFLTSSSRAQHALVDAGLLPLLVGMLRAGRSLEPVLAEAALRLLAALLAAAAQGGATRAALLSNVQGLTAVSSHFLARKDPGCQRLAAAILRDLVLTSAGRAAMRRSQALQQALLDCLAAQPGDSDGQEERQHTAALQKQIRIIEKLAQALGPTAS